MTTDKSILRKFGANVRKFRDKAGLTQEQLAEQAGLDITYVSGIERGLRNPSLLSLLQLTKALSVSLENLTKGIEA